MRPPLGLLPVLDFTSGALLFGPPPLLPWEPAPQPPGLPASAWSPPAPPTPDPLAVLLPGGLPFSLAPAGPAPRPDIPAGPAATSRAAPAANPDTLEGYDARLDAQRLDGFGDAPLTLRGGAGRHVILGGEGHDTLIGGSGDTLFSGGLGDDLILGGPGRDTIATGLFRSEAPLDAARGLLHEPWGTDRFEGIERITHRDGFWALCASEPAALAVRLAEAVLGRAPRPLELAEWAAFLEAGGTGEALAARLLARAEQAGPDAAMTARIAEALAPAAPAPLAEPLWVPDREAVLALRLHLLVTGGAPDRDAFDLWLPRLAAAHAAAAEAFLAAHPGSAYADGAALLEAAWTMTAGEAGVPLSGGWFL